MKSLSFDEVVDALRVRLADGALPGLAAQVAMAPAHREELLKLDHGRPCREAGVLALLFPVEREPTLLLTVRRDDLPDHPGQISFPGGRREPGEDLLATALRETHEEVGLPPDKVDILGALTPLYIPPTNYCVSPFVGALAYEPDLRPTDAEVASILRVPLACLLDPATQKCEEWLVRGQRVMIPFYAVEHFSVWGATAMMLAEMLSLLNAFEPANRVH